MFFIFAVYLQPERYSSIYIGTKTLANMILQFQSLPQQLLGITFANVGRILQ